MIRFLLSLCLFFSSALLMAQPPKAVITGPKQANLGDLIILDATQSQGQGYLWVLLEEKSFLPVDNGTKCVFATGQKGVYHFVLVVSGTNANNGPAAAMARWDVSVSVDGPSPGPSPGPQPDPQPAPIKQVYAVIVFDKNKVMTPGESDVCKGKTLQDWFIQQGWKGDDGLPTLVRIQHDGAIDISEPNKKAWVQKSQAAAVSSGRALPVMVWTADLNSPAPNIEPIQANEAEMVKRLTAIKEGKP